MKVINGQETLFIKIIGKLLPDRMKRMIMISTFIANINDSKHPDQELLSKINNLLTLAKGEGAMVFPMSLHSRIWNEKEIKDIFASKNIRVNSLTEIANYKFSGAQARILSEELVNNTPNWLRYSSRTEMKLDLVKVLRNINILIDPKVQ